MRHEIVVIVEYGEERRTAVVGMRLPRIPNMGENLSFEGYLDGVYPTNLVLGVISVLDAYGFGSSFEEYLRRTEIETICAADVTPEQLTGILSEYPFTEWIDHNDGRGVQKIDHDKKV